MFLKATKIRSSTIRRSFAGMGGAKPQKIGDNTHIETAIVCAGQFFNTGNNVLGSFCKHNPKTPAGLFNDKSRGIFHDYSKDLHVQGAFKNEAASGKSIFQEPPKGYYYKIDSDVVKFDPQNNKVILQDKEFTYDNLILAGEFQFDWGKVENLERAVKDYWNSHVLSFAQAPCNDLVKRASQDFRYDNFVYAIPKSPHKNEGTHHFTYFYDQLKKDKLTMTQWFKSKFYITTPDNFIHRAPHVNEQLLSMAEARGIQVKYNLQLVKVDYNQISDYHRVANVIFRNTKTGETEVLSYGTLVTNPECKVPEVLAPFTDSTGFVTVDKYSLQHTQFPNVFAVGECTNLPTINNSISVLNQAMVVAKNIGYKNKNMPLKAYYDGTTATPIFTGKGQMIMPGFDYNFNEVNTWLTTDTTSPLAGLKQSLSFMLFKRYEKKYFEKKLKGKIYGPPNWTKPGKSKPPKALETAKSH